MVGLASDWLPSVDESPGRVAADPDHRVDRPHSRSLQVNGQATGCDYRGAVTQLMRTCMTTRQLRRVLVTGGAGFIGSNVSGW